jgi:hypothetical protein
MYGFCSVWVCVCVGFVMFGCLYVWVLECVGLCMCGFCNVWVCVYVDFVMCEIFYNCVGVLVICVLVFTVFNIVSFMYMYSYLLLV